MNEENENQSATGRTRGGEPAPLETQSASPEQRHPRPRRRFPRRRYRGDRFRRDNSEESPNSSSANADNAGADVAVETLDQPASGGAEKPLRAVAKPANRFRANRNLVRASLKSPAKGSGFCAIRNAILSRRRRISLSPPKLCAASPCATACGSTAKSGAAAVVRN